jgi:hypothetical protein
MDNEEWERFWKKSKNEYYLSKTEIELYLDSYSRKQEIEFNESRIVDKFRWYLSVKEKSWGEWLSKQKSNFK